MGYGKHGNNIYKWKNVQITKVGTIDISTKTPTIKRQKGESETISIDHLEKLGVKEFYVKGTENKLNF
jgi:hypothetical protein